MPRAAYPDDLHGFGSLESVAKPAIVRDADEHADTQMAAPQIQCLEIGLVHIKHIVNGHRLQSKLGVGLVERHKSTAVDTAPFSVELIECGRQSIETSENHHHLQANWQQRAEHDAAAAIDGNRSE